MKIGELFIALGFRADQQKLNKFESGLQGAKKNALALKVAVVATTAAVLKLTDASLKYAVSLKNFAVQTGLSVQELEKWRFVAEQNDVSGEELISTIKGLQRAQAEIKLGGGNIRPWQLLGISPNENPFTILEQLRSRVKNLNPALAASVLGQLGIGQNFLNILKVSNLEFSKLNKKFLLTKKETNDLLVLNRAFKDIIFSLRGFRNRLLALSSEPLQRILGALKNVALFTLDVAFKVRELAQRFDFIAKVILIAAGAIAAYFFPVTAAIAGVILVIDDLYVFLQGGESVIGKFVKAFTHAFNTIKTAVKEEIQVTIDFVKRLVEIFDNLTGKRVREEIQVTIDFVKRLVEIFNDLKNVILEVYNLIIGRFVGAFGRMNKLIKSITDKFDFSGVKLDASPSSPVRNNQNVSNNATVTININGAKNPKETAQAVQDGLQKQLNTAYFQTPIFGVS